MNKDRKREQLKILQVAPFFYPAWAYGGIPRVVYDLSRSLVRKGHEVTVFTTDVFDQDYRYKVSNEIMDVNGIRVRYFKNVNNALAYNYQIYLPFGLCSTVKKTISNYDIVHLHGHRHLLNNIVHYQVIKSKIPYVFSGHGTVLRIERRKIEKIVFDKIFGNRILRDAKKFIAVSEHETAQYKEMRIEEAKVSVIYNGIELDAFKRLPNKNTFRDKYDMVNKKIILYLGKITPRKGVDFLVRAFSELKMKDAVLVIAGNDMGFKSTVQKIIREKEIEDEVLFTGLLIDEEKLSAYRDADVLVYPAIHEIFGLVPFEAIMCGTPVIVTDDCGCGEIIGGEDIGYTVSYNDVSMLKETIKKVINDRNEAEMKVEKGQEFIRNNLDWEIIGEKYFDVYRSVLK